MKPTSLPLWAALFTAAPLVTFTFPAIATDNCSTSFYCYGNSARTVTTIRPNPAPLPPPNRRNLNQRHRTVMALRPTPPNRTVARPPATLPHPATPTRRLPPPTHNNRPAEVNVSIIPGNSNRTANRCEPQRQRWLQQATQRENQAVTASRQGDRNTATRLFREAHQLRQQAANCR